MVALEPLMTTQAQQRRNEPELWHAAQRGGKPDTDEALLRELVESHFRHTGSFRAKEILEKWATERQHFVKVMPNEYVRALREMSAREADVAHRAAA